jgi:hypothetical protein
MVSRRAQQRMVVMLATDPVYQPPVDATRDERHFSANVCDIRPDGPAVRFDYRPIAQHAGIWALHPKIKLISRRSVARTARCVTT